MTFQSFFLSLTVSSSLHNLCKIDAYNFFAFFFSPVRSCNMKCSLVSFFVCFTLDSFPIHQRSFVFLMYCISFQFVFQLHNAFQLENTYECLRIYVLFRINIRFILHFTLRGHTLKKKMFTTICATYLFNYECTLKPYNN